MTTHHQTDATPLVVDPDQQAALVAMGAATNRSPAELLKEAVGVYLDFSPEDWAAIEEGLRDADAGRFASDEEVARLFPGLV